MGCGYFELNVVVRNVHVGWAIWQCGWCGEKITCSNEYGCLLVILLDKAIFISLCNLAFAIVLTVRVGFLVHFLIQMSACFVIVMQILDFCPAFYKIRDMGFQPDHVARALAQHNNDEEQAVIALVGA